MRITTTIFLLILTTYIFGQATKLNCTIKTESYIYKTGSIPNITVEIKNNSDSTFQLVKTLDGSSTQIRFPYAYFEIQKLSDTSCKVNSYRYCGNYDEIDSADFVEVRPGGTFDPYKYQTPVYSDHAIRDPENFKKKGKYKIIYHYSTNEPDFVKWMGDKYAGQAGKWFDWKTGKVVPDKEAEYNKLLALFKLVPKMELVSNELIIEIK